MAAQVCVVDHERPGTHSIGGRWFCEEHFAKATGKRGSVWRSQVMALLGLIVFVAAVVALDTALKPEFTRAGLLITGVVLVIVPALLWLYVFYRQDRLEPEPVGHVARMFVIGLALAGSIGIPITDQLFRVQDWLYQSATTTLLGSIFIIGGVQAFIVYATLRYFIFDSPEFDERTDGVIYGAAAGLGYATALNLQFILGSGGAALGTGEVFVIEVALAQAAFGGLLGYFLGKARLEREPIWWLPLGLALAAVLSGAFNFLRTNLDPGSISTAPSSGLPSFTGLALAGGLAVVVALVVYALINRDIARSLKGNQPAATDDPATGDRQSNLATVGAFAVILIVGALLWNSAVNGAVAFNQGGFAGAYPATYGDATSEDDVLRVADTLGTGAEFALQARPIEAGQRAEHIAAQLGGERSTDYAVYKVNETTSATVNGKPALAQRFVFVDARGFSGANPEVMAGTDYIIIDGDRAVVISLIAPSDALADVEPLFARFLNSLTF